MIVKIPIKKYKYAVDLKIDTTINKPFIKVVNDTGTVNLFFDAIVKKDLDDAKAYVSKKFIDVIDLAELKEVIGTKKICKYVAMAEYNEGKTHFRTNSVILVENGISSLVHVHLIQEPDHFGKWKIFGIEKES